MDEGGDRDGDGEREGRGPARVLYPPTVQHLSRVFFAPPSILVSPPSVIFYFGKRFLARRLAVLSAIYMLMHSLKPLTANSFCCIH